MVMTNPKPFVFVLMPFAAEFDDVYQLGIKPACENAGAYAERVDEQLFQESILQRVYNQIWKADLVVADMTEKNANVFYETGYAHALGKTVILLTRDSDDIPFDLKHYPHIIYEGRIAELAPELERRIRWALKEPGKQGIPASKLEVYYERTQVEPGAAIEMSWGTGNSSYFKLGFDIHNADETSLETAVFEYAVISPEEFYKSYADPELRSPHAVVKLPDGHNVHLPGKKYSILPQGWKKIALRLYRRAFLEDAEEIPLVLRLFTELGIRDVSFLVRFRNRRE